MNQPMFVVLLWSSVFLSMGAGLSVIGRPLIEARSNLSDDAFKMEMKDAIILKNEDYLARFVNIAENPALTAVDVQFNFIDLQIKSGKSSFRHTHPRSSEALFVVKGKVKVSIWFEGLAARIVSNVVNSREYAVVPQGLPHVVTCVSRNDCFFVVFFRSSDPGLIPAPLRDH